jgi:phosphoribosyl 1,2-cyclic phosphate phosphodiesterase
MKVTVLGCGGSTGVPSVGDFWGKCDPNEPRNRRTRCSVLLQTAATNILVDTGHDVTAQLNRTDIKHLDGVLITHPHSDHINGLDDLRPLSFQNKKLIDIYGNAGTIQELKRLWPHMVRGGVNDSFYPPTFDHKTIPGHGSFTIGDVEINTFEQDHTTCVSQGYRFGNFAYSVDVADLNDRALEALKGVDTWIVDACSYHKEEVLTHANLKRVMKWVDILKPRMTYLTVLSSGMDYKTMCDELPSHVRPAYDGMTMIF